MFHGSTTIFHHQNDDSHTGIRPKRMTYNVLEGIGNKWTGFKEGAKSKYDKFKRATLPARIPFMPIGWTVKGSRWAYQKGDKKFTEAWYTGKEAGGATKDMVGRPLLTLLSTPVMSAWQKTIGTTRIAFNRLVNYPSRIWGTRQRYAEALKDKGSRIWNLPTTLLENTGWNPFKTINGWRKSIGHVLAPSITMNTFGPLVEPAGAVAYNIADSYAMYGTAPFTAAKQGREGWERMKGAPRVGVENAAAAEKAEAAAAKAEAKKEAEKEAAAKGGKAA